MSHPRAQAVPALLSSEGSPQAATATSIKDRRSKELVFALVGPIGSGCSTVAEEISKILRDDYLYEVPQTIKVADFIRSEGKRVGLTPLQRRDGLDDYVAAMQDAGNRLRERFGNTYLIEKSVERIHVERKKHGAISSGIIIPKRIAYVIDSIKNEDELNLLREIYGDSLLLLGVFAPDTVRNLRLNIKDPEQRRFSEILKRDQGESSSFGQKTRKIFVKSDFFICNDGDLYQLRGKLCRICDLVFDIGIRTPTRDESSMYRAWAAAANSACMSRQVGASIVSRTGELIGIGWNDVPRFGGGLYDEDARIAGKEDNRCYAWADGECHNEIRRNEIITSVVQKVFTAGILKRGATQEDVRKAIGETRIDSLIEFSRSIHAEMEAIISVAREAKNSLVGATLYTNTYPCHNCARHIVAAGIDRVVFVEPYLKSLAMQLHKDAITETENPAKDQGKDEQTTNGRNKVLFQQFDGVAPRNYLQLFRPQAERKENGRLRMTNRRTALPILTIPLDGPMTYESKVLADLAKKEGTT